MSRLGEQTLKPGDQLAGRYGLVRVLGEGGMGIVWEARQLTTEKPVAIKVLRSREASDAARFLREAKVAAQLSHRNVVQVFDFWGDSDGAGQAFMVMELLAGEALSALLARSGRLAARETLGIVVPVASALRAAHGQGIVHRDLKPENIFLASSADGGPTEVKVLDFGLARPVVANSVATAITQTGSMMGTPFYMAPEQVYGEKDIDTRADVWALGVVIYECLSGDKPFRGENFGQVFRAVTRAEFRPLREAASHAPAALDTLVARMLSHDRGDRPDIKAVAEYLAGLDFRTGTLVLPTPPPASLAPTPAVPTMLGATASVRRSIPAPPKGRMRLAMAASAATAGIALGVLLTLHSQSRAPSPSADQPAALPPPAAPPPAAAAAAPVQEESPAGTTPSVPEPASSAPAPSSTGAKATPRALKVRPAPSSSAPPRSPSDLLGRRF